MTLIGLSIVERALRRLKHSTIESVYSPMIHYCFSDETNISNMGCMDVVVAARFNAQCIAFHGAIFGGEPQGSIAPTGAQH